MFFVETRTSLVSRKGEKLDFSSNNSLTGIYNDTQEQLEKTQANCKDQFNEMLCCVGPWNDPASAYNAQTGVSPYPGMNRPLNPAGGPAAVNNAAPPMVNVVVPAGMQPGQTLQVAAPDGSRTVMATIPQGMSPGQSFIVSFPVVNSDNNSQGSTNSSNGSDGSNGPISTPVAASVVPQAQAPVAQSAAPFSLALDNPPPATQASNNSNQQLLLVSVPPGTAAGATLYVQVPGENRTLKATVPPGVSQFHVAYQPRTTTPTMAVAPLPAPTPAPMPVNPVPTTNNNGQRLILVRVPPGTAPGSTLHVEVPDEPGRILAAQVPPNVAEFQVAYIPRRPLTMSHQPVAPRHTMANDGGSMMSNAMVPFVGAAAMGAAGVAMYDHYHHHNQQHSGYHQDFDPYSGGGGGYYDDGGGGAYDYGGGDYGGDFGMY